MTVFSTVPEPDQKDKEWVDRCVKKIDPDLVAIPSRHFPRQWDVLGRDKSIVAIIDLKLKAIAVIDIQKTNAIAKMAVWFEKNDTTKNIYTIYSP